MPPDDFRRLIEARLARKWSRAESAYARERTAKATANCRFRGGHLGGKLSVCRLGCRGADEHESATCHDAKARACPDFVAARSPEAARAEFRAMGEEVLLRWPSLGELRWVLTEYDKAVAGVGP